jgi:amino acid permease
MKRRTFDKLVSFVGLGLALLLFIFAGLLNFGAAFANDNVQTQLKNQNIAFPDEAGLPANTKDQLLKWAGQQVVTGEMARDYSDLYILEHMNASATAVMGKPATYSEVSGVYMGLVRGGSTDEAKIKQYGDLRQTLFMGNTLRGMLLQAYAFGTFGVIAGYAALASLLAGILFLVLAIAGLAHIRRTPEDAMI